MAIAGSAPPKSHVEPVACIEAPTVKVLCYQRCCQGLSSVGLYQNGLARVGWMSGGSVCSFEDVQGKTLVQLLFLCR